MTAPAVQRLGAAVLVRGLALLELQYLLALGAPGHGELPAELAAGPTHSRWAGPQGWHEWRRAVDDWCEASGVGSEQLPERFRYWRSSHGRAHARSIRGESG